MPSPPALRAPPSGSGISRSGFAVPCLTTSHATLPMSGLRISALDAALQREWLFLNAEPGGDRP